MNKEIKKIKKSFIRFWTKKPKYNVWYYIATAFISYYLIIRFTLLAMAFSFGLLAPESDMHLTLQRAAEQTVASVMKGLGTAFEAGKNIALAYPTLAYWLAQGIGYALFGAMLYIICYCGLNIIRSMVRK